MDRSGGSFSGRILSSIKPKSLGYIGACISECAYEVGADVADHFLSTHKRLDPKRQKYFLDLKSANKSQLLAAGLPEEQIEISPDCTFLHNDRYFSHRKEKGATGRMLAVIGISGS